MSDAVCQINQLRRHSDRNKQMIAISRATSSSLTMASSSIGSKCVYLSVSFVPIYLSICPSAHFYQLSLLSVVRSIICPNVHVSVWRSKFRVAPPLCSLWVGQFYAFPRRSLKLTWEAAESLASMGMPVCKCALTTPRKHMAHMETEVATITSKRHGH